MGKQKLKIKKRILIGRNRINELFAWKERKICQKIEFHHDDDNEEKNSNWDF